MKPAWRELLYSSQVCFAAEIFVLFSGLNPLNTLRMWMGCWSWGGGEGGRASCCQILLQIKHDPVQCHAERVHGGVTRVQVYRPRRCWPSWARTTGTTHTCAGGRTSRPGNACVCVQRGEKARKNQRTKRERRDTHRLSLTSDSFRLTFLSFSPALRTQQPSPARSFCVWNAGKARAFVYDKRGRGEKTAHGTRTEMSKGLTNVSKRAWLRIHCLTCARYCQVRSANVVTEPRNLRWKTERNREGK